MQLRSPKGILSGLLPETYTSLFADVSFGLSQTPEGLVGWPEQ